MEVPARDDLPLSTHYDQIKLWQERTGPDPEHQDQGVISRLSRNCQHTLQCLIQHLDTAFISTSERNTLRRSLASLKLWSDGHGATTGALDMTLDRSKDLRLTTLSVLIPMCKTLSHGLRVHVLPRSHNEVIVHLYTTATEMYHQTRWLLTSRDDDMSDNDSDSNSDSDSSISSDDDDSSKMHDLLQNIKTYTDSLTDLGIALACPALEPEVEDVPRQVMSEQRFAHDYHTDLITAKFPQAERSLLQNLGKINWERYLRMQQERDANAHKVHATNSSNKSGSEFRDSGLGTSIPPQPSSYAESTVSFMTSVAGEKRIQIPPLTAGAKNGIPFECNACGMRIRVTTNREWRNHLYTDLRPYTCLYTNCRYNVKPFVYRQRWSDHLELGHELGPHWDSLGCPLCLENIDAGKKRILSHFARHLEDIAVASLPQDVESDAESESESSIDSAFVGSSPMPILDGEIEPSTIKCICGFTVDDGNTVLCEVCSTWQHIFCFYESAEHVPDVHECVDCNPRPMDSNRAAANQRQQRQQKSHSSTSEQRATSLIRSNPEPHHGQYRVETHRQQAQQQKKMPSAEHPHALQSVNNMAMPLSEHGQSLEAEHIHHETPQLHQKIHDKEHPNTLRSYQTLLMQRTLRKNAFTCTVEGCNKAFDRNCELNRHLKTHIPHNERPHRCTCGEAFLYPKDLTRHQREHVSQASAKVIYHCHVPGCQNMEGFSRRDNLLRHHRRQHEHYSEKKTETVLGS